MEGVEGNNPLAKIVQRGRIMVKCSCRWRLNGGRIDGVKIGDQAWARCVK